MITGRRQFLQAAAGTASLCLADFHSLSGLAAMAVEQPAEKIRFGPDVEPIVRLMEETPREDCVRVFVAELQRGLPYRTAKLRWRPLVPVSLFAPSGQ